MSGSVRSLRAFVWMSFATARTPRTRRADRSAASFAAYLSTKPVSVITPSDATTAMSCALTSGSSSSSRRTASCNCMSVLHDRLLPTRHLPSSLPRERPPLLCASASMSEQLRYQLSNPEIEHDGHEDVDRLSGEAAGLEPPLADRDGRLLVQSARIERSDNPNVRRTAGRANHELDDDRALNLLEQCLARVGGFDLGEDSRGRHRSARTVDTAADASAFARAYARAAARPDARTDALADAPA